MEGPSTVGGVMSEPGPDFEKEARHYRFLAEITEAVELERGTRQRILETLQALATHARQLAHQDRASPIPQSTENQRQE
ncbi:MAG: hypothetical protein ACFE0O_09340 [Opitutales bacterium]